MKSRSLEQIRKWRKKRVTENVRRIQFWYTVCLLRVFWSLTALFFVVRIDLDKAKEEWWHLSGPSQIRTIAEHYGIFEHLFGDAYFTPVVPLHADYDLGNDCITKVHRGNLMKPVETVNEPTVYWDAKPDSLWTLLLTTPDCNFINSSNELCHWFM